jgi:hypothetical protein
MLLALRGRNFFINIGRAAAEWNINTDGGILKLILGILTRY